MSTDAVAPPVSPPPPQLQMVWPEHLLAAPPAVVVPDGYVIRQFAEADFADYQRLMAIAGFDGWTEARTREAQSRILPRGFFEIEHHATLALAATAQATHNPIEQHPFGGELGWVAGDPAHKGRGLGAAVCAAATARLIAAGYENIYLRTDDFRLPAIRIYLKLGYVPFPYGDGMRERWAAVRSALRM